jgi:hypothetical protein
MKSTENKIRDIYEYIKYSDEGSPLCEACIHYFHAHDKYINGEGDDIHGLRYVDGLAQDVFDLAKVELEEDISKEK